MFTEKQEQEIFELLLTVGPDTKIYLGCDSVRYKKGGIWQAKYATVCIIHINGNKGCRIFSNISREIDIDAKNKTPMNRPKMRMLQEVQKVCQLSIQLLPLISEFPVEIHLDINLDPKHGSSCAAQEAAGYVLAMTGIEPKLKPDSFAASFGADAIVNGRG